MLHGSISFYTSLRATLKETFKATYDGVLPRTLYLKSKSETYTPKRDGEHLYPFHVGVPTSTGGGGGGGVGKGGRGNYRRLVGAVG